ncbi:hypothetical protein CRG98_018083 [Punica granatum]|uniref:Uncharacterized protein n=1 Tax=Punica granatum TaxID=22663 RepID=A0A2I0JYT6_PUNGR|nr:hypothetical protein CRG98_018083 [Punica granatum]
MNEPFTGALGQPQRRPVGSVGIVRFVCPHGIWLLEPSLGRLRMPTHNRGKYTYVAPSHGTRRSQAKNDTQVHISLRIPLGPFPHTLTREVSDEYVPPTKPKTETIEQTIQPRRMRLHRDRATPRGKLGLPHYKDPSPTTCNDKSRGRTHSASRVPII